MALTKLFRESILAKIKADREFARALFQEALDSIVENDVPVALSILRDLTHAGLGFKALAKKTGVPEKSLHRMLGTAGNPRLDNLASVLGSIRDGLER